MKNWLAFKPVSVPVSRKTQVWDVTSSTDPEAFLGTISWYSNWRRYVFHPHVETLFDAKCLEVIAKFINDEMNKRKNA